VIVTPLEGGASDIGNRWQSDDQLQTSARVNKCVPQASNGLAESPFQPLPNVDACRESAGLVAGALSFFGPLRVPRSQAQRRTIVRALLGSRIRRADVWVSIRLTEAAVARPGEGRMSEHVKVLLQSGLVTASASSSGRFTSAARPRLPP